MGENIDQRWTKTSARGPGIGESISPRTRAPTWCPAKPASTPLFGRIFCLFLFSPDTYTHAGFSSWTRNRQVPWKQNWLWESGQSLKWDLTAAATGGPGAGGQKHGENTPKRHFFSVGISIFRVDIFISGLLVQRLHSEPGLRDGAQAGPYLNQS